MAPMPPAPVRLVTVCLVAALAGAGCLGGPSKDPERGASDVTIFLTGFDAPEAGDDLAVTFTIGHIGLYDGDRLEWVALLAAPVVVDLFFDALDPAVVGLVPIANGRYTDAEMLIDAAEVFSPSMESQAATVDMSTCFAAISFDLTVADAPNELELLVSGSEGIRGGPGAWMVRPALAGSLSNAEDADPELGETSCA